MAVQTPGSAYTFKESRGDGITRAEKQLGAPAGAENVSVDFPLADTENVSLQLATKTYGVALNGEALAI
jgi:hypothetical protein